MSLSLELLRNRIRTSLYGRRLGLGNNDDLIGARNVTLPRVSGTSDTTGTDLPNHGLVSVITTTDDTWRLTDPYPGAQVILMTGSSSTGTHLINLKNSVAYSTHGIAGSTVVLVGSGAAITMVGLSTAIWQVISRAASSASNYVSS